MGVSSPALSGSLHAAKETSTFFGSPSTSLIGSALEYGDQAMTASVTPAAAASHGLQVTRRRLPLGATFPRSGIGPAWDAHQARPAASSLARAAAGIGRKS